MIRKLSALLLSLSFLGCGSSGSSATYSQSCSWVNITGGCKDFGASETTVQADCAEEEGVYSTSLCPTENRVGTCYSPYIEMALRFYSSTASGAAWTVETARAYCGANRFVAN